MSQTFSLLLLAILAISLTAISIYNPDLISDHGNSFLRELVGADLLNLLGVILAITLASAGNLHLALNRLQETRGVSFEGTRRFLKASAATLIVTFVAATVLVIVKPLVGGGSPATATVNSIAIVLVAINLLVLIDLTLAVFKIPPDKPGA